MYSKCLLLVLYMIGLGVKYGWAYKRVCYYTNWSQYRTGDGRYTVDNIEASLCTHLIYAFAKVIGNELLYVEWNDDVMYTEFRQIRLDNPGLKTLVAVGGWNAASAEFTKMVATAPNRAKFIQSSLTFLRDNGLDGLDLDWEYPAKRGGVPADKFNFGLLVKELKVAFELGGYLLTAAVPAGKETIDDGYNVALIAQHLDFINLMSYDLHGSWEKNTGIHSPLYARGTESETDKLLNMKWAAEYWVSKGTPKQKLIIGMAMYGRSFTLLDPGVHGVGANATGPGDAGQFTKEAGFMAYYEVCTLEDAGQGQTFWNDEQKVPYFTQDKLWVGFDNKRSITEKVNWLIREGYGGAMIWSLDSDDFKKVCSSSQKPYPLLSTINDLLTSAPPLTSQPPQTTAGPNGAYRATIFQMHVLLISLLAVSIGQSLN